MTLNARDDIFDGSAVRNLKPVSDFLFVVGQNAVPHGLNIVSTPAAVAVSFRTASSLTVSTDYGFTSRRISSHNDAKNVGSVRYKQDLRCAHPETDCERQIFPQRALHRVSTLFPN